MSLKYKLSLALSVVILGTSLASYADQVYQGSVSVPLNVVMAYSLSGAYQPFKAPVCSRYFNNKYHSTKKTIQVDYNINLTTAMMSGVAHVDGRDYTLYPLGVSQPSINNFLQFSTDESSNYKIFFSIRLSDKEAKGSIDEIAKSPTESLVCSMEKPA